MALRAQNFGMDRDTRDAPKDYVRECGQRLEFARTALGYPNRSAFVRLLAGDSADEGDVKRRLAQLEKWEQGKALARPWFIDRLKKVFGITQDYIFSGDKTGLRPDVAIKLDELEHKNHP